MAHLVIKSLLLTLAGMHISAFAQSACDLPARRPADTEDTLRLQSAIDRCAATGGGELSIPAGDYEIAPIALRSHVLLRLERGAVLHALREPSRFERAFLAWPFRPGEALIYGHQIHDAGVIGPGTVDGRGQAWWPDAVRQRRDGSMARMFPDVPDANGMPRPWLMEFSQSGRIRLAGFTLKDSPMWNLVLRNSSEIQIQGLSIQNPADSPNTDGIDVLSSRQVDIQDVDIATGDDDIAIKSGLAGLDADGGPVSQVQVKRVRIKSGHGISVGSETIHDISQIAFSDIDMENVSNGFRIKTGRDRGSHISDIRLSQIRMRQLGMALSISAYYPSVPAQRDSAQPIGPTTPYIHKVLLEHISVQGASSAGQFIGLPERALEGIELRDISIEAAKGLLVRDAEVTLKNVSVRAPQ